MRINDRIMNIRRTKQLVRRGWHNSLKCSAGVAESQMHRNVKFLLASYCLDHGLDFYTEASFVGGGRADFLVSDWAVAIEVLHTEDRDRFLKKSYPLVTIPVRSNINVFELTAILDDLATCGGTNAQFYVNK